MKFFADSEYSVTIVFCIRGLELLRITRFIFQLNNVIYNYLIPVENAEIGIGTGNKLNTVLTSPIKFTVDSIQGKKPDFTFQVAPVAKSTVIWTTSVCLKISSKFRSG